MTRKNILSGAFTEEQIGFSRAVRAGGHIAVSGTAPINDDGTTAFLGDVYEQSKYCFKIAQEAIEKAGGKLADVTRTRIMLVDISTWQDAARAHSEIFKDIKPASTFVEVKGFINPEWLVEIEMDCFIEG